MHHVRKVVRDALERPWHAVRRWTQYVWDSVESRQFNWSDRDVIQEERVRLCLTSSSITTGVNVTENKKAPANNQVICHLYNTRIGCQHRESHGDTHIWFIHACSYCDSVGKTCYHSVRECERRITHARNDSAQQHRNRAPHKIHSIIPSQMVTNKASIHIINRISQKTACRRPATRACRRAGKQHTY